MGLLARLQNFAERLFGKRKSVAACTASKPLSIEQLENGIRISMYSLNANGDFLHLGSGILRLSGSGSQALGLFASMPCLEFRPRGKNRGESIVLLLKS